MGISDRARNALRALFGVERDERDQAESPSGEALQSAPATTYAIWGRDNIGGLLSVSQSLMGRFADYEAMNDYPDIRCFSGEMKVFVVDEGSIITPIPISKLAIDGEGRSILAFDREKQMIVRVPAQRPRISGRNAAVIKLKLSNNEVLRVTPNHKILTVTKGYINAEDLRKGDLLVAARGGFETRGKSILTSNAAGTVWVIEDPSPDGVETVYDVTTSTHNLLVNGVVCHNSAFHFFANDATQPNMDNGRVVWVNSQDDAIRDTADVLLKKKLRLEDDLFSIAYTLCIGKGGRVWGDSLTEIQNAKAGDLVTGFDNGKRADFAVKRRMDNGRAHVVCVKTAHREFYATPDHRVLTEDDRGVRSWTRIKDFKCHSHPGGQRGASNTKIVVSTRSGPGRIKTWDELLQTNIFLQEWGNKGAPTQVQLPPTIEPWFCRLYGFLLGDGFLVGDYQVVFARDPKATDINDYYDSLLCRLGVEPTLRQTDQGEYTVVSSVQLNRLLSALGFTNDATKKRMPAWVFGLPEEHREEFLWGFIDADGWTSEPKTWTRPVFHFEISNYDLARDLKNLIDGLGYRSGNLRKRTRKPGFKIKDIEVKTTAPSFCLSFSTYRYEQPFVAEPVLSIEPAGEMDVFDIEVDSDAHNFVVDGVVVHNCQYGNDYEEVLVTDNGVVGLNHLPPPTMRRVEKLNGSLIGYVQDITGRFSTDQEELRRLLASTTELPPHIALFEDWQAIHFRLRSTARRSPYGVSVAEGARWIWKRLVMLEDAVMIYKLTRSPARYAFYVDVTDVPANKVESFLRRAKRDLKKRKMVNPNNNFLDMRYNPLANDEDYIIAVRDGRNLSRVEVLSGPDYQNVDDVMYFLRKLHGALMVPRAYLGQEEPLQGRAILSNEDVRAARVTLQVQRELKNGIERLIRIDQAARGIPNPWQTEFDVMMTVPSNIYELAALEVKNARADFAARIAPYVSRRWLMETVYKFSDDEIKAIDRQRRKEAQEADKMGMDPSFGSFTGGRPPSHEEQMAMQQQAMDQEEEGAPAEVQARGSDLDPSLDPAPPPKNAPQLAWKLYDQRRRLEERRYQESRRNQSQLMEKIEQLQKNDADFAARLRETQEFLKEFRSAALRRIGGHVVAVPSAQPRSRISAALRG